MKKLVLAPDKFKGSITAVEFCELVESAIKRISPITSIVKCPLADGGDGTLDVLKSHLGGQQITVEVNDPLFRPVKADYLFSEQSKTAYIEMSSASGIRLLKENEANPLRTTTYGTGELIVDALQRGAQRILLGIGGSATNDAGLGMARALGYRFYDVNNVELKGVGADLIRLHRIEESSVVEQIKEVVFEVACDVGNPLYGHQGAAFIYAEQKGATTETLHKLDRGLRHFGSLMHRIRGVNPQDIKGAGAAGGLGAGAVVFLNARLLPGIELVMKVADFVSKIQDADWVITGEGRLDEQTLSGKVIQGVLNVKTTQKVAVFCGSITLQKAVKEIDYLAELSTLAATPEESVVQASDLLMQVAEQFARKIL